MISYENQVCCSTQPGVQPASMELTTIGIPCSVPPLTLNPRPPFLRCTVTSLAPRTLFIYKQLRPQTLVVCAMWDCVHVRKQAATSKRIPVEQGEWLRRMVVLETLGTTWLNY